VQLEDPDEDITLRRAAALSGLSKATLHVQARAGKLQTIQPTRIRYTTRRWLHAYLMGAAARDTGKRKPLPPAYVAPD
jgi:hypothetical protein